MFSGKHTSNSSRDVLIEVGAAEVVAALAAHQLAAVAPQARRAVGAVDAVVLAWLLLQRAMLCGSGNFFAGCGFGCGAHAHSLSHTCILCGERIHAPATVQFHSWFDSVALA